MIKNKVDFKLINTALIVLIIYLIYQTKDFWFGILSVVGKIIFPFFIAFVLAYAIYPLVRKLVNKKIPKPLAIIIVVFGILAILGLLISLITPLLTTQMRSLFDGIVTFLKNFIVAIIKIESGKAIIIPIIPKSIPPINTEEITISGCTLFVFP